MKNHLPSTVPCPCPIRWPFSPGMFTWTTRDLFFLFLKRRLAKLGKAETRVFALCTRASASSIRANRVRMCFKFVSREFRSSTIMYLLVFDTPRANCGTQWTVAQVSPNPRLIFHRKGWSTPRRWKKRAFNPFPIGHCGNSEAGYSSEEGTR